MLDEIGNNNFVITTYLFPDALLLSFGRLMRDTCWDLTILGSGDNNINLNNYNNYYCPSVLPEKYQGMC